ncbi:MAG: CHAP domain-containing protein [Candidatus Nanoperiomorbaceae bacterium]
MVKLTQTAIKLSHSARKHSRGRALGILAYGGAFVIIALLVAASMLPSTANGQLNDVSPQNVGNNFTASSNLPIVTSTDAQTADVASTVAASAGLNSTDSASSRAITMNAIVADAQTDVTSANKSSSAGIASNMLPISSYTVQNGDSAATIAGKFGVSDQTVRAANNLSDDTVTPGSSLQVPMVNGVIYTTVNGDTLPAIAAKYNSNVDNIVAINNLANQNVSAGTRLLLPDGVAPANPTPTTAAAATGNGNGEEVAGGGVTSSAPGTGGSVAQPGNSYYFGECTWYAYNRRVALGLPVGSFWGNANTWAIGAARSGLTVNHTPSAGAIIQTTAGYYGHVGIVESVNPNGSITISEMNYQGWDKVDTRTISNPSSYNFIH